MRTPRRHYRLIRILLLLLAMANAAVAQGGIWRCDTGQACFGHGARGCCCPPERLADMDQDAASGDSCAPRAATPSDSGGSCCADAGRLSGPAAPSVQAAPHCRCAYTIAAAAETAMEPAPLPPPATVAVLPGTLPTLLPAPSVVAFVTAGDRPPLPNRNTRSPWGSRAPPAC